MFVGQRAEGFAANIGPIFDLVDAPAAVITNPADRGAVPNPLQYKNVTTLALEVSASCLTAGTQTTIGGWTTASVRQARVINPSATYTRPSREGGAWTQVSRLGMPLVNEVVIGIKDKDRFNSSEPKDDGQFATYVTNPTLPAISRSSSGPPAPTLFPRTDLVAVFLTGVTGGQRHGRCLRIPAPQHRPPGDRCCRPERPRRGGVLRQRRADSRQRWLRSGRLPQRPSSG